MSFELLWCLREIPLKRFILVKFAFFFIIFPSLHILLIFFLSENIKNVFMPNALKLWILCSVDCRMCCSVVFYLCPLKILFKNSQRETDDSRTKVPHCTVLCPLLHPWAPCSSKTPLLSPLICTNLPSEFFQTLQCIKHYSRWCFLTMPFYMKQHFVVYAALSKNQTCNYANMYAFIIIKFYCKWLMHINLIL